MRVYSIAGLPPELQAYAMARFSRSPMSLLESIDYVRSRSASEFLQTYYFDYGHRSIADLAHLAFAFEDVSMLAAIRILDEPLWDGQEKSSRYQDFGLASYYLPPDIAESNEREDYRSIIEMLFKAYRTVSADLFDLASRKVRRPSSFSQGRFERSLKSRVLDVARSLLPLATLTNLSQITSARVLERQICRLLADPLGEVNGIGLALRQACEEPPVNPAVTRMRERLSRLAGSAKDNEGGHRGGLDELMVEQPLAPTLVKYVAPDSYGRDTSQLFARLARRLGTGPSAPPLRRVDLICQVSPGDEVIATLLYSETRRGHSFAELLKWVGSLSANQKQRLLKTSVKFRGQFDELLRSHRCGYSYIFDIVMDIGAYRDLHRHRRCVHVVQPFSPTLGFEEPSDVIAAGLGQSVGRAAVRAGIADSYRNAIGDAGRCYERLARLHPASAAYILPLAFQCRALMKMDFAEAAYIIELRSSAAGHFSYRRIAYSMFDELRARSPELVALVKPAPGRRRLHLFAR